MVLVNENLNTAITMLDELLTDCIYEGTNININGNVNNFIVRNTVQIEEYSFEPDEFYLVGGWFELDIKENILEIDYNKDENSVHIVFACGELYLDFGYNE